MTVLGNHSTTPIDQVQRMERVAIYCRVSTKGQEEKGTSLESQEAACRSYCVERSYETIGNHVYREVYSGAELWDRPKLSLLREAVKTRDVDVVVVYDTDRLSRDPIHFGILLEEASRFDVRIEFVNDPPDNSPEGEMLRFIKGLFAKFERAKTRERTLRGKRQRALNGNPIGGTLPYGYRWAEEDRLTLVPDPDTAQWVTRMFEWASEGKTLRWIAHHLSELGVQTPRKRWGWAHTTVRSMLTNPTYMGKREAFRYVLYTGPSKSPDASGRYRTIKRMVERPIEERIPLPANVVVPLTSEETFKAVQARLELNARLSARNSRYPQDAVLLRGFAYCAHCGGRLNVKRVGPGGKYFHYRCIRGMASKKKCEGASIPSHWIDDVVWEQVKSILTDPNQIEAQLRHLRDIDPTASELADVEHAIESIERKIGNLVDQLAEFGGSVAERVRAQLHELQEDLTTQVARRHELIAHKRSWELGKRRMDDIALWCKNMATTLITLDHSARQQALMALGVQVRVWRAGNEPRYEITMTVPLDEPVVVDKSSARWAGRRPDPPCGCRPAPG